MAGETLGPLHGLPIGIKDLALTEGLRDHLRLAPVRRLRAGGRRAPGRGGAPGRRRSWSARPTRRSSAPAPIRSTRSTARPAIRSTRTRPAPARPAARRWRSRPAWCRSRPARTWAGRCAIPRRIAAWSASAPARARCRTSCAWSAGRRSACRAPMGRTVADTALLFGVMAGTDPRDRLSWPQASCHAARAGRSRQPARRDQRGSRLRPGRRRHPAGVPRCGRRASAACSLAPTTATRRSTTAPTRRSRSPARSTSWRRTRETWRSRPEMLGPNVSANVEQGLAMSLEDVARAMQAHTLLYRRFLEFMADYDALICPAMAVPPFPHAPAVRRGRSTASACAPTSTGWRCAYGLTLTAHPVACIPCGRDHTGMPFGIQVCGRRYGDRRTLAIAAALERHLQTSPSSPARCPTSGG